MNVNYYPNAHIDYQIVDTVATIGSGCAEENLINYFEQLNLKYYHDLSKGLYVRAPCRKASGSVFQLKKNNTLVYNRPIYRTEIIIDIGYCSQCHSIDEHRIELNKPLKLGYCPYFENAANKIIRWVKRIQCKIQEKEKPDLQTARELLELQWKDDMQSVADEWDVRYGELEQQYTTNKSSVLEKKMRALRQILALQQLELELERDIRILELEADL